MKKVFFKLLGYLPLVASLFFVTSCNKSESLTDGIEVLMDTKAFPTLPPFPTFTVPPTAVPLAEATRVISGQSYTVDGVYTGNIPFNGTTGPKATIFVRGVLDPTNWNIENGLDLVVMPGGQFQATTNNSMVVNGNSNLYIMQNGQAEYKNDYSNIANEAYVAGLLMSAYTQ